MASFLRSTCKIVGLKHSSRLHCRKFFTPHTLAIRQAPNRGYGGSPYEGRGHRVRASPDYVVGGTIAACTGIWLYASHAKTESENPNRNIQGRRDTNGLGFEFLLRNFVSSRKNVDEGRWWTLITSTFTHFAPAHLAVNMFSLWSVGRPIVLFYGAPTFALLWLGAGVSGGALQIYWSDIMRQAAKNKIIDKHFGTEQDRGAIGASASILGMAGVMSCAFPGNSLWTLGFVAGSIFCIEYGFLPWIGHKSHLGGFGVGVTWWLLFLRRRRGW